MNIKSREEIIRKRNQELVSENEELKMQLEDIKSKLDEIAKLNSDESVKNKILQLEHLHKEWVKIIRELQKQSEEYQNLIDDLQIVKEIMIKKGFKVSWFQKFFDQFQKK